MTVSGVPPARKRLMQSISQRTLFGDINKAVTLLADLPQQHCSHIDKYVANGIKARIALYMGDYQVAHDTALIAVKGGTFAFDEGFHYNDATDNSVLWGAEIITEQGIW